MKLTILLAALCFLTGMGMGVFIEHRLDKPVSIDCELIDYAQVEEIVARQLKSHSAPMLDVNKLKHVKSFTYAPVVCSCDSVAR